MTNNKKINKHKSYKRIAVEEFWTIPEIYADMREIALSNSKEEPGVASLWGDVMKTAGANPFGDILCDAGLQRIEIMDNSGIDLG